MEILIIILTAVVMLVCLADIFQFQKAKRDLVKMYKGFYSFGYLDKEKADRILIELKNHFSNLHSYLSVADLRVITGLMFVGGQPISEKYGWSKYEIDQLFIAFCSCDNSYRIYLPKPHRIKF